MSVFANVWSSLFYLSLCWEYFSPGIPGVGMGLLNKLPKAVCGRSETSSALVVINASLN